MKTPLLSFTISLVPYLLFFSSAGAAPSGSPARLQAVNAFEKPEQVVEYYCARDAAGFVWSGLLDSERRAFTAWKEAPAHDSFHVARKYKVHGARYVNSTSTEAEVDVIYDLIGTSDAHGTWIPENNRELRVRFRLKKHSGLWKIHSPLPSGISPVIVHGLFPYTKPPR